MALLKKKKPSIEERMLDLLDTQGKALEDIQARLTKIEEPKGEEPETEEPKGEEPETEEPKGEEPETEEPKAEELKASDQAILDKLANIEAKMNALQEENKELSKMDAAEEFKVGANEVGLLINVDAKNTKSYPWEEEADRRLGIK